MSDIDNAIARLQDLALACTDIKHAPDYPVEDASVLPIAIAHVRNGNFSADDATAYRALDVINVDVHFARMFMKDTYTRINRFVPEFQSRLAGDPTLNGTVNTIVFPATYDVAPAQWDSVTTQMVQFSITVKTRNTSVST